ncbi:hydroxyacylglutathione hydrolase [Mariprofundus ferrinatatus]|uniref:Hydroxyacylglutathione hydrolase n=1 Tax=Mariprofundus ferrinatatus TaxID=1921087 RepID=A0A2K8L177_9PROT|nr:rhodanese-like domain-containing protein [Mariprofundus ferrinatatus]ATX81070.1 hydroxyacylglutathione hydrolase [Mariprofundus ferrinatatus]
MRIYIRSLLFLLLSTLAACSLESGAPVLTQTQLLDAINSGEKILILDVRTPEEYAQGYIPGARHIDHREIDGRLHEIAGYRQHPVVVYCLSGMRASMVESALLENGFERVFHLQGDWSAWKTNNLPVAIPEPQTGQL